MGSSRAHAGRLATAAGAGFLVLTLEFAAVRLFAPAFGQSTYVWATVIGVLLVALAAGYALGGRLGDRARSDRPLFLALLLAALWTLLALTVGPALTHVLMPVGLPRGGGLPLAFWGGLVATLLLFAPPAFLLGMTSPFLIRRDARVGHTGQAAGSIYAFGTLGSLVGSYLTPIFLLQRLGTRTTLLLCVALAAGMGGLGLLAARRGAPVASPNREPNDRRPVPRGWLVIALLLGLAVTLVEFAAVRFMAPWFGQSNHVWAHVIGVLMLALALGSWLGGRRADRPASGGLLWRVANAASFWLFLAASFGPLLFEWLAPARLSSMGILPAARWGSLVATAVLFGTPFLLLGMTTPFLVRRASEGAPVGRSAGAVLAFGTVGGLFGCLLTPLLLVPQFGSRGTLLMTAALVASVAALGIHRERRPGRVSGMLPAAGVVACLLGVWFWHDRPLRELPGQIMELESGYQTLRVVERTDRLLLPPELPALGSPVGRIPVRFLRHDEDAETFQSAELLVPPDRMVEFQDPESGDFFRKPLPPSPAGDPLTGGQYFEHMALGARLCSPRPGRAVRVLIVGYAGGSLHRVLRATRPAGTALDLLGIEIDPAVIRVADDYLDHRELRAAYDKRRKGPGDRLRLVTGEDARTVINALPKTEQFDLVLLDAYARTNYIPFQLATREFFSEVASHLAPGGWIGVNVLGDGTHSRVARSVALTMTRAVGPTWIVPNPSYPGNVLLYSAPATAAAARAPRVGQGPIPQWLMRRAAYSLERLLLRYDAEAEDDPEVVVFTDDKSPSDQLADEEFGA